MKRFRVTVAQLMALVLFAGFGFAALRNATPLWAGAAFDLAIISVSVAVVGTITRRGRARAPWAGFAITCGACFAIRLLSSSSAGGRDGPPRPLLYQLQEYVNPAASGGRELIAYAQTSLALEAILLGLVAAVLGCLVAAEDDRPTP